MGAEENPIIDDPPDFTATNQSDHHAPKHLNKIGWLIAKQAYTANKQTWWHKAK